MCIRDRREAAQGAEGFAQLADRRAEIAEALQTAVQCAAVVLQQLLDIAAAALERGHQALGAFQHLAALAVEQMIGVLHQRGGFAGGGAGLAQGLAQLCLLYTSRCV